MRSLLLIFVLSVALPAGLGGCFFKSSTSQASSESSSKSSSSPFRSSSKSSSPERYGGDVAEATRSWSLEEGNVADLQRDISRVAADAGISDWESRQSTWESVGLGLKRGGVSGERLEALKGELSGGDPERVQWITSGYESE
jgi:hypothetical protein